MADFINFGDLLTRVDWNTVTEQQSFDDLPEGFYLCEVEKVELRMNKAETNMQASFTYKVVESGLAEAVDERGNSVLQELKGTVNRKVFKHYPFKDTNGIKKFVVDVAKFEDESGNSLLNLEIEPGCTVLNYFQEADKFSTALEIFIGCRIYVQASYKESQGKKNCWYDIISWDRAAKLGLPVD